MVFYTALLLINELTFQQLECSSGSMLMKFSGLTMSPTFLKQLA